MAETTKGFKVSEELKEKINGTIKASGLSDMSWIEAVTNLWILQDAKVGLPNYSQDISELELHTKRINELVLNMILRSANEKDVINRQKIELQGENEELVKQLDRSSKELETLIAFHEEDKESYEKDKEEALRLKRQMEASAEHNNLLIKEYKDKNDNLIGLISEYKSGYEQSNDLKTEVTRLTQVIKELETKLAESNNVIKLLENSHKDNIQRLIERKDVERERELLRIQSEYQAKIHTLNEESTKTIQFLYGRIDQVRNEYQDKISAIKETQVSG